MASLENCNKHLKRRVNTNLKFFQKSEGRNISKLNLRDEDYSDTRATQCRRRIIQNEHWYKTPQ